MTQISFSLIKVVGSNTVLGNIKTFWESLQLI